MCRKTFSAQWSAELTWGNDYITKINIQIQCNPHQNPWYALQNYNSPKIYMEAQKTIMAKATIPVLNCTTEPQWQDQQSRHRYRCADWWTRKEALEINPQLQSSNLSNKSKTYIGKNTSHFDKWLLVKLDLLI